MTGAACLWAWMAGIFAFAAFLIICKIAWEVIEENIKWKGAIFGILIVLFCTVPCIVCSYACQKCYDVNFAVAMKNINYTRTTEVNTNIEMNYQDITKENK
jgi:hypothetical protein